MPIIRFQKHRDGIDVAKGCTILQAAIDNGIHLYHTCGGNCSCSTCHVRVLSGQENLSPMHEDEAGVLDSFDLAAPHRLGCQARIQGDVEVEIPTRRREPRPNKTPQVPGEDAA